MAKINDLENPIQQIQFELWTQLLNRKTIRKENRMNKVVRTETDLPERNRKNCLKHVSLAITPFKVAKHMPNV